ncbi:MAG: dihydrodipicolinate synthase family protein [Minwuiales bacterium]|nr:dihydrodipicolinate synthase family protein [Minwuiales bacterium]
MLYAFFDPTGAFDRPAMTRQVEAVLSSGSHGVAVLGLATEVNKLDTGERRALLDIVAETLDGKLPLAVTVAEPSIEGQIAFARAARDNGAQWIVLQPPPVRQANETELVRFFGAVADRVDLPVAIQNAPAYIGVGLSIPAMATLHRNHPNVALLKAEGPAVYLRRLIEETDGVFRVFNGRAGMELTDSLRAGCVGMIPGVDACDVESEIYALYQAGETDAADERFRRLLPLLTFLMEDVDTLLCYGKRLTARRLGIGEVHDRAPTVEPTPFGLSLLDRLALDLPPFP